MLDYTRIHVVQRAKRLEVNTEYDVLDQHGNFAGAVAQIGQSIAKKALRAATSFDELMSHRFELTDAGGRTLFDMKRPRHLGLSTFEVSRDGRVVGRLCQQPIGQAAVFALLAGERQIGRALAGPALNLLLVDANGEQVAEVVHDRRGSVTRERESLDRYTLIVRQPVSEPLRTLLFAAPVAYDVALNQQSLNRNRL